MLVFNKYFCNIKKSYLCFGDRMAILNDFFCGYEGRSCRKPTHKLFAYDLYLRENDFFIDACLDARIVWT
jgi:hypothetical protein